MEHSKRSFIFLITVVVLAVTGVWAFSLFVPRQQQQQPREVAIKSVRIIPWDNSYIIPTLGSAIKVVTKDSLPCGDSNSTVFYNFYAGTGWGGLLNPIAYSEKKFEMQVWSSYWDEKKGICILQAVKVSPLEQP